MPAYFDSGFSVREPMWHGEGIVLDEYPQDWEDARRLAGLQWEPMSLEPTYVVPSDVAATLDVSTLPDGWQKNENGSLLVPDPAHRLIVRDDTWGVLAATTPAFRLVSHAQMGELLEAFVKAGDGKLKFETAGSCKGGAMVWALVYLDEPYEIPGDNSQHYTFAALLNPHDGSGACKATYTNVKVVCWNTFQMASAEGDRHGEQVIIRHTGDIDAKVEAAKQTIAAMREEQAEYVDLAGELMKLNVNDEYLSKFLSEFLPSPRENGEIVSDRVHENVERARSMFRSIYNDAITTEGIRGTAWGLLQTSTEYLDHARSYRSSDTYLGRSILRPEPAKAKALQLIRGLS